MFKLAAVAMMALSVIGAAGVAVYDSQTSEPVAAEAQAAESLPTSADNRVSAPSDTEVPAVVQSSTAGEGQPQTAPQASQVGEPWVATGVIGTVDATGFDLILDGTGQIAYVELGPTAYWQGQGVALNTGERVTVQGFAQDGLYHAAVVTAGNGMQIRTRDLTTGQPLWSGGVQGGQAQSGAGLQDGSQVPQPEAQVSPDAWYTVEGQITAMAQNNLTMMTRAGLQLTLQLGRSGFAADQGVVFAVGDEVKVLGYDQTGVFRAGEIENLTQGGRLMLLDPNGRPLWAGPGSAGTQGTGGGSTNGGAGNANAGAGNTNAGAGNQAAGNQTDDGGTTVRGYRGGR